MSYDLYLYRPGDRPPLTRAEFLAHFQGRRCYQVSDAEAAYWNEDTGAYFQFHFSEVGPDGQSSQPTVSLALNYYRPHIFGLEAEPEVGALVEACNLSVEDHVVQGLGRGPYTREGFLRAWNTGNRLAYQAVLTTPEKWLRVYALPARVLERCWLWNYERAAWIERMEKGEEIVYYPRISFLPHGKAASYVLWTEDLPTALPEVDFLLILRTRSIADARHLFALVPWKQLATVAGHFEMRTGPLRYYYPRYTEVPKDVLRFCARWNSMAREPEAILMGEVLDRALVREFCPRLLR